MADDKPDNNAKKKFLSPFEKMRKEKKEKHVNERKQRLKNFKRKKRLKIPSLILRAKESRRKKYSDQRQERKAKKEKTERHLINLMSELFDTEHSMLISWEPLKEVIFENPKSHYVQSLSSVIKDMQSTAKLIQAQKLTEEPNLSIKYCQNSLKLILC